MKRLCQHIVHGGVQSTAGPRAISVQVCRRDSRKPIIAIFIGTALIAVFFRTSTEERSYSELKCKSLNSSIDILEHLDMNFALWLL